MVVDLTAKLAEVAGYVTNRHDTYPDIDPQKANLTGSSVVITGASKGVGRATAISFARAGCSKIAIAARSDLSSLAIEMRKAAKEAQRPEPIIVSMVVDVTSEDNVKAFAAEVGKQFGGTVDVLINNAGYMENWLPFAETNPTDWWHSYEINIKGLYLCSRFFLPLVLKSEAKTILNLTSVGALVTMHGASAYQSAKLAVCRLTEFMVSDHAADGLIAISVHPGGVRTELGLSMPEYTHAHLMDEPELAGDMMVWLCKERRDWLKGRYVSANWDVKELEAKREDIEGGDKLKFRMII